jgi:hypothetical protein
MELVLVYGPIVLAGIIGFMVFDQLVIAFILLSASVIYAFAFRPKIIQFTESVLPPVYDKMNIDEAAQHLKKHKSSPKNVLNYLIEHRNIQKEEAYKIIAKHFSSQKPNNKIESDDTKSTVEEKTSKAEEAKKDTNSQKPNRSPEETLAKIRRVKKETESIFSQLKELSPEELDWIEWFNSLPEKHKQIVEKYRKRGFDVNQDNFEYYLKKYTDSQK